MLVSVTNIGTATASNVRRGQRPGVTCRSLALPLWKQTSVVLSRTLLLSGAELLGHPFLRKSWWLPLGVRLRSSPCVADQFSLSSMILGSQPCV